MASSSSAGGMDVDVVARALDDSGTSDGQERVPLLAGVQPSDQVQADENEVPAGPNRAHKGAVQFALFVAKWRTSSQWRAGETALTYRGSQSSLHLLLPCLLRISNPLVASLRRLWPRPHPHLWRAR